jgi:hypothetical protein
MATDHSNVELIPGTEIVQDSSAQKTLIPTPSSDPRDPLNWTRRWKRTLFLTTGFRLRLQLSQSW